MLQSLKITVGQVTDGSKTSEEFTNLFDKKNGMKYKSPHKQLAYFYKGVKVARQDQANFLIFPELFLPNDYLEKYVAKEAEESNTIIIGGLEWTERPNRNGNRVIGNHAFVAIPSILKKNSSLPKSKATIIKIPKMFPSPEEETLLNKNGYQFQSNNRLYLFQSSTVGNWAVLICFDYLNLPIQKILQTKIQTLFVVAYNKDLGYFHTLSDTLHRILFCNVVVCNSGNYGGSHSFTPYRKVHQRQVFEIKGNQVDTATTIELPLKLLVEEQKSVSNSHNSSFMQKPPNYDMNL
ncbi:hypothetical protein [Bacillus sp. FJAT-44742]|uniref:hypothetical protein n=1 Tax=Bacillus sp. FJAT-44742 TaxID=2014005 RepID=UPI000C24203A|nr:hypothetical protein [Bacillus sp. FJAT-44742]